MQLQLADANICTYIINKECKRDKNKSTRIHVQPFKCLITESYACNLFSDYSQLAMKFQFQYLNHS